MQRFFLSQNLAEEMEITGADAHHIGRVLRMKPGDTISVSDPGGQAAVARILSIDSEKVSLKLIQKILSETEPPLKLWLAQGMPKADKLEFIIQKAVELGAAGIIPVKTETAVVKYDADKGRVKTDRWQKIAAEAAKQCGRQTIPPVKEIHTLKQILDNLDKDTLAVMPYENEAAQPLANVIGRYSGASVIVFIGPEGGFTPAEVELCRTYGVQTVTLGPRILRTETAALAAVAVIMYQCGDLGSTNR